MSVTPLHTYLWPVMLTGYLHDYYLLFYLLTLVFPLIQTKVTKQIGNTRGRKRRFSDYEQLLSMRTY